MAEIGFFVEDGLLRKFTIYRGIRYVQTQPIAVERIPDTIYCCQAEFIKKDLMESERCEH